MTCYDSGAVQGNYSFAFTTEPLASIPAGSNFAIGLEVEESGTPLGNGSISLALGAGDNGVLNMTSLTYGNGSFNGIGTTSSLNVSAPGSSDNIVAGLPLSSGYSPTVVSPNVILTAVSSPFHASLAEMLLGAKHSSLYAMIEARTLPQENT